MATAREASMRVDAHEKECAIRYEHIEKRLQEGSEKFKRLELILWGLYAPISINISLPASSPSPSVEHQPTRLDPLLDLCITV